MKRTLILFFCAVILTGVPCGGAGKMVKVPAAEFDRIDGATEVPVKVSVEGFLMGATEVTQAEFRDSMGYNPSISKGERKPVENVSWWEAIRYCNLRSRQEGLEPCYDLASGDCDFQCTGYRLPTEAEWEQARGDVGERTPEETAQFAYLGSTETKSTQDLMERVARGTAAVASRSPNPYGLYDILGNVWEWCNDINDPDRGTVSSFVNPAGPSWGPERVLRGGSYVTIQGHWSRSFRSSIRPDHKSRFAGFRVVRRTNFEGFRPEPADKAFLATFQQIPQGFEGNLGGLSSLVASDGGTRIASVTDWEERRSVLKKRWETLMGVPSSPTTAPDVKLIQKIDTRHYKGKLMYLRTEPDSWEKVFLMLPHKPLLKPTPAVIVPYYDVDVPAGENLGGRSFRPPSVRSFAHLLVRQGYIALAVRWFGESYGVNYNEAVANLKTRHPEMNGLGKWVKDARKVVDYLTTLPEVDQDRIGIVGHSLGAKMTLYAAAMDDRINVAVFSEGGIGLKFSNYEDYWYWGESIQEIPEQSDHHELLALIAPRPFLLIGGDDADNDNSWFFVNAAREVYEIYRQPEAIGFYNHRSGHSPTPESVHLALEWFKYFFGQVD